MINRTLFYWSRLYSGQIKRGIGYKELNRTITINILNFEYIQSQKYHNIYHLYEDEVKSKLTDLLEIHFVELPKFLKQQPKMNNSLNGWLTFLINPKKEEIEMAEPAIKKAITVLDMLSRDPETVRLAELRMKQILDERSMLEGAKEEGIVLSKVEDIIECLSELGPVTEELRKTLYKETNIEVLKAWFKLSLKCQSIEEFIDKANLIK